MPTRDAAERVFRSQGKRDVGPAAATQINNLIKELDAVLDMTEDPRSIELGYLHAWWSSASLDITDDGAGRVRGSTDRKVNYLGLSVGIEF